MSIYQPARCCYRQFNYIFSVALLAAVSTHSLTRPSIRPTGTDFRQVHYGTAPSERGSQSSLALRPRNLTVPMAINKGSHGTNECLDH